MLPVPAWLKSRTRQRSKNDVTNNRWVRIYFLFLFLLADPLLSLQNSAKPLSD